MIESSSSTRHCPNCFQVSDHGICPWCHFDSTQCINESHYLPLFSLVGNYITGRVLGEDELTITYIAKKRGGKELFAIKEFHPKSLSVRCQKTFKIKIRNSPDVKAVFKLSLKSFVEEAKILESCQRYPAIDGIVRYADLLQQSGTIYLVTEYLEGFNLYQATDSGTKILSNAQIKQWLKPLLDILEKLHQHHRYHKNIQLQNIYLRDGGEPFSLPILMGFDVYRQIKSPLIQSIFLHAPEQMSEDPKAVIGVRTDLYLLGAVLYQCLNGKSIPALKDRYKNPELSYNNASIDPILRRAVNSCLSIEKKDRPRNITALKKLLKLFFTPKNPENSTVEIAENPQKNAAENQQALWEYTKQQDTIDAYKKYLGHYQSGEQTDIAVEAIKRLDLEERLTDLVEHIQQPSPTPEIANTLLLSITQDTLRNGTSAPTMVLLPSGCFLMGTAKNKKETIENEKQQSVEIKTPFYISQFPVTFAEYNAYCQENDVIYQSESSLERLTEGQSQHPVTHVSWFDASSYCKWLSEKTGKHYRLPSEAEWEYACRAESQSPYYFGHKMENLKDYAWYKKNSEGQTQPVGLKKPNIWGLYDMHGNVWEWTDSEAPDYNASELLHSLTNANNYPIIRGGSWDDLPWWLRSAYRDKCDATYRDDDLGFRIAKTY